jgi:hypothetical protein
MAVLGLIIYFAVKWFKQKNDLLINVRRARIRMCSTHGSLPTATRWFKWNIKKNPPIRCMYMDNDNKIKITRPIGYYLGHYNSEEGNMMVSFYTPTSMSFWIFPKTELLMINDIKQRKVKYADKDSGEEKIEELVLPVAQDIVSINNSPPEVILQFCKGIDIDSSFGMFYLPSVCDIEGRTINLSPIMMWSMREITSLQMYFDQLGIQAKTNQIAVKGNPGVRMGQLFGDSNSTIEQRPL